MSTKIDVRISGGGGFYLFKALTARARRWVEKEIAPAPYQVTRDGFACDDTTYAVDIARAMRAFGLTIGRGA